MLVACLSDTHGLLPTDIPPADVLVIAGDICPTCSHDVNFQYRWFNDNWLPWAKNLHRSGIVKKIVWVGGNHDFFLEQVGEALANPSGDYRMSTEWDRITYLQDTSVIVNLDELGKSKYEHQKRELNFMECRGKDASLIGPLI